MRVRGLLVTLVLAVLVACGPASGPTASPEGATPTAVANPTEPGASGEPSIPVEPSDDPVATPPQSPSVEPIDPSPSESAGSGAAAACSGSDENRLFFEDAASVLNWTVYCAVLPSGWFVDSGEYRRAGGGRLEIAYRGPGGARLELREGAFCTDATGCIPSGADAGSAPFGDQTGTLIATDDGGWGLVVDRDAPISWLAIGTGMDEDTFRAITSALTAVAG
jgi:hypothetical protein